MRDRIARLRFWLAASAFLLVAVIAGFIGYGRYISHLRHVRLPLPPGVDIVREAGGWTYSRANGARTLYTIHAAGFQQGRNGKTTLHDVSVVLFGKNGDRHDRVSGHDFEYDEKEGVLRALGLVHIDLESAKAVKAIGQNGQASTVEGPEGEESLAPNVIHVTTSGLVYLDKLGVAATSEDVDVQTGGMKGHAHGADYSSDSGVLMLHSAVTMAGVSGGHQVHITAAQAQFEQPTQVARLTNATYESEGRSVAADRAVLHRRANGTLGSVEAEGNVRLTDRDAKVVARRADLEMNAAGQPASAVLSGEVTYNDNQPLRQVRAEANQVQVAFGGSGHNSPEHAVFTGDVHAVERLRPAKSVEAWNSRELTAQKLDAWMVTPAGGAIRLHSAEATGQARLVSVNAAAGQGSGAEQTELSGDELKATTSGEGSALALNRVTGRGHTTLSQVTKTGMQQTSTADTVEAQFVQAKGAVKGAPKGIAETAFAAANLSSAVQQGHLAMTRRIPAHLDSTHKQVPEQVQHAVADRAAYDGSKDQVTLSGAVRMGDAASTMWARQVTFDRASGDAHAAGSVKVDYAGAAGSASRPADAMHISAERAEMKGEDSSATFFGNPVRVWQGGDQIQAPEVEVQREANRLIARGSGNGAGNRATVRTILVTATQNRSGDPQNYAASAQRGCGVPAGVSAQGGAAQPASSSVVRIISGGLVYSGREHQIDFTGGVRADTADATVRAREATAFLAGDRHGQSASVPSLEGGLNRIEARGPVDVARAGTRGFGDKLVYEAATRTFLLSGSAGEPAKATDARGTTTAAAFRFNACDDTLDALGDAPGAQPQRVNTDAVASGAKKREKGER